MKLGPYTQPQIDIIVCLFVSKRIQCNSYPRLFRFQHIPGKNRGQKSLPLQPFPLLLRAGVRRLGVWYRNGIDSLGGKIRRDKLLLLVASITSIIQLAESVLEIVTVRVIPRIIIWVLEVGGSISAHELGV
jgi:hypothetical protein